MERTWNSGMPTPEPDLLQRIADLESENTGLRISLEALSGSGADKGGYGSPDARILKKYDDLSKVYRRLRDEHSRCRPYIDKANEKYRAARDSARQWQTYLDRQREKSDKLITANKDIRKASSPPKGISDHERTPRAASPKIPQCGPLDGPSAFEEVEEVNKASHLDANRKVDVGIASPYRPQLEQHASSGMPDNRLPRITSSQTTELGSDPAAAEVSGLGSDPEPQVVSARPVKRRRGNSPRQVKASTQIKQEVTSPSQPLEICSDDFSSPVLQRRQPERTETSNLDTIAENLDLPIDNRSRRAVSAEVIRPPTMLTTASSLSEGDASESHTMLVKEEPRVFVDLPGPRFKRHDLASPSEGSSTGDRALQPLSANIARSSRSHVSPNKTKRKRRGGDPRFEAAILSEDGDMNSSQVHAQERQSAALSSATAGRLDSLLDEPAPEQRHHIIRRSMGGKSTPRNGPHLATPEQPVTAVKTRVAQDAHYESRPIFKIPRIPHEVLLPRERRDASTEADPPPIDPEDEPLRSRPVLRLSIDDFKINSEYGGTNFAYADTIRGRDQRRCLPGCTRPECCGDAFRKAAEMGVHSKQTDNKALEAYLGPNYRTFMKSRPQAEQDDLLIKARTHAIASEHGKHRQAFKRRSTPPGFWRADMPSTQEMEQDRKKAADQVRQEVYDRWREALNPGGRWKFRDE